MQSYELCCDMIDVVIDVSCIYGVREENDAAAFDEQSSSLIKLNNGTILYLREVNKFLALVCILREDNFDHKGKFNILYMIHSRCKKKRAGWIVSKRCCQNALILCWDNF